MRWVLLLKPAVFDKIGKLAFTCFPSFLDVAFKKFCFSMQLLQILKPRIDHVYVAVEAFLIISGPNNK